MFGDRTYGTLLPTFAWTKIVRHQLVPGRASPDDPALAHYWANRRRTQPPSLGRGTLRLLRAQHGRCPLCGDYLLHADREPTSPREWERWLTGHPYRDRVVPRILRSCSAATGPTEVVIASW